MGSAVQEGVRLCINMVSFAFPESHYDRACRVSKERDIFGESFLPVVSTAKVATSTKTRKRRNACEHQHSLSTLPQVQHSFTEETEQETRRSHT